MAKRKRKKWFRSGVWWNKIRLNRKHKDRLFRYLFKEKKYLLDLYNALHDSDYTEDAIQAAMNHCIGQNILTDILKSEKSEVLHMIFLTEYDEKEHLRHTFAEGKEEGREDKLFEMIQKKHAKGKSPEVIAEEVEEDLETVHDLLKRL